jgi:K+-transporting ATPase KdpF subunit
VTGGVAVEIVAAGVVVGLVLYLLAALLRPEWF